MTMEPGEGEMVKELLLVVSDLLDYVEPCDVDPRPAAYCTTHHCRDCRSDELCMKASQLIGLLKVKP